MKGVCAVFVTYNPDISTFKKAVKSIIGQVDKIYVIDNCSMDTVRDFIFTIDGIEKIFLENNMGVASGFNKGIELAKKDNYRFLLLLDQDSVAPKNMVYCYMEAFEYLSKQFKAIAAIGPRYENIRTKRKSKFVKFGWFRNIYNSGSDSQTIVPTDCLISSGSFFPLGVFSDIGKFDEKLFIDHVDTEWCQRALYHGYRIFGLWDVVMEHSLGEWTLNLWFLRWHSQPMHQPFRLYYIARNSILLYKMSHVPLKWISGDIVRLLRLLILYALFSRSRAQSLGWFLRGIRDGVRNITGPMPTKPV
jgi:rhamnosyltransferase